MEFEDEIAGAEAFGRSSNAITDGSAVQLVSAGNEVSWAVWKFSPGMETLVSVEAVMNVQTDEKAYIGLADYARNSWQFGSPVSTGMKLTLNDARHKSDNGAFCIAIVTAGGDMATVFKVILKTESEWAIQTVDAGETSAAGVYSSIAVVAGKPAIAYGMASHELKYVRSVDGTGIAWGSPVSIASGPKCEHISMAITPGGHPGVCWFYATYPGELMYTSATDTGDYWKTNVRVDGTYPDGNDVGRFASLASDGFDKMAISYYDENLNALKYVKGYSDWGDWGLPDVAAIGECYYTTLLYEAYNRPLITYYEAESQELKLVGRNAEGTDWNPPQTIDTEGDVGSFASGAMVNSQPGISYYDATNGDLKFAHYDMTGEEWVRVVVDSAGDVGQYTSLAVIAGSPAVSYYDAGNGDLKYVRALNANGSSWSTPQIVDSIGDVGLYTSLAEIDGRPAISYHDSTSGHLKYAYYVD